MIIFYWKEVHMEDFPKSMSLQDVMDKLNSSGTVQISAWADGKHRTAFQNVERVIVNHRSDKNEPEILIITKKWVFRYTYKYDDFIEEKYEIDQFLDKFGRSVLDGLE